MKPDSNLKLVGELRDLQIVDVTGRRCGIVDDVELAGRAGASLRLKALLVGPGTYLNRLPRWIAMLLAPVLPRRIVRVPWTGVKRITAVVELKQAAAAYGLAHYEASLESWLSRIPGARS